MSGHLTFNVGEVRRLMEHAKAATSHRPSYEDQFKPEYHLGGVVKMKSGWPDPDNLNLDAIPAGLWLVKDKGIYLLSNGNPGLLIESGEGRHLVVYAVECNPDTNEDYWEIGQSIMGGDDCVITLPISMFDLAIRGKDDKDTFQLHAMEDAIELVTVKATKKPK